jgi:guanylate kinase
LSNTSQQSSGSAIARRGLLLVLSSPSGAGKTTLAGELLKAEPGIAISVSVTTRKPRPGEVHGRDYIFCDEPAFEQMRDSDALLEWASVHGNLYGTPKSAVMDLLAAGKDVLFDIDWQGAQQLKERAPEDLVRVFILPPSAGALEQRLKTRAQDDAAVVSRRLAAASAEIGHWAEYEYVIINENVGASLEGLRAILAAERLRRSRQQGLADFVRGLQSGL